MAKYGVLITNIGTPKSFSTEDVARYLEEFLTDPNVIRAPSFIRNLLVKGLIVPNRAVKSAALYQKIWTHEGSPLMVQSKRFVEGLQEALGNDWQVRIGMRYSEPSIQQALSSMQLEKLEKIFLFPMFPQYALSSTHSATTKFQEEITKIEKAKGLSLKGKIVTVPPFFDAKGFIEAWVTIFIEEALLDYDHVVMSFHGLPLSHLTALSKNCKTCPKKEACASTCDSNPEQQNCYRRQSFRTAERIAKELQIPKDKWSVGFQSRLGPLEWIGPNTVDLVKDLGRQGKKRLVVLCPSFVADCLETLEEVHISLKETFLSSGGQDFKALSCLNAHPVWIEGAKEILCQKLNP